MTGRPFGTAWLVFADSVRILVLMLAVINLGRAVVDAWRHARGLAVGVALICLVAGETEWDHLGQPVGLGGRLWLTLAALAVITAAYRRPPVPRQWRRARAAPRQEQ
ncbi:MAG: hypothetical protein ACRDXE_10700 [Acidimicrobiales bacterium]